jgi:hypothetical protein
MEGLAVVPFHEHEAASTSSVLPYYHDGGELAFHCLVISHPILSLLLVSVIDSLTRHHGVACRKEVPSRPQDWKRLLW